MKNSAKYGIVHIVQCVYLVPNIQNNELRRIKNK